MQYELIILIDLRAFGNSQKKRTKESACLRLSRQRSRSACSLSLFSASASDIRRSREFLAQLTIGLFFSACVSFEDAFVARRAQENNAAEAPDDAKSRAPPRPQHIDPRRESLEALNEPSFRALTKRWCSGHGDRCSVREDG